MPLDHEEQGRTISRRSLIVLGGAAAGFGILAGRLYHLQILQGDHYRAEAKRNQTDFEVLLPKRGAILDARGYPIADSLIEYDLVLIEEFNDLETAQLEETLTQLDLDSETESLFTDKILSRHQRPLPMLRNLSSKQLERLEFHRPKLPKFSIRQQIRRQYYKKSYTPITGYIARASKTDRAKTPHALLEEFRVGKTGIERQYEKFLQGTVGKQELKVNVHGKRLQEVQRTDSTAGFDVQLHIHGDLQDYAMKRIAEHRSAAAVVLDTSTGGVIALASHPFYDAEDFKSGISQDSWKTLLEDPLKPMVNKAISGLYAPGSTFKPIVALAALRAGIHPEAQHFCRGHVQVGNARFHCWKKHGHGKMNLHQAIAESCDVWFYQVARQIGIEAIAEMARELGLGMETGLDLEGANTGLVPDKAWKRKKYDAPFYPGEVMIHGIGQGFLLATPLQLARAYGCIANGGSLVTPMLGQRLRDTDGKFHNIPSTPARETNIPERHFRIVRDALNAAVNTRAGTAWRSQIDAGWGFAMAGKTGTTQVRRITRAERAAGIRKENIDWHLRDHGLFVGFASMDNPRYVVAAVVEHGVSGGKSAAPIARDLFYRMAQIGMIQS